MFFSFLTNRFVPTLKSVIAMKDMIRKRLVKKVIIQYAIFRILNVIWREHESEAKHARDGNEI